MEYNLENAIEQMRAGEEAGLNYVYSKTYNYVYLRAKNILKKENDIQALMKDVYVQAMNKAAEIRKENLYEWLGKCVYTLGCQRFRKKKAREATVLEIEQSEISSRKMNQLEAAVEIIQDSLEQLPELYQATAYAFYYDHMSIKMIAEAMDVEEGVILNRLNYVRKYIMKAMEIHQEEKKEKVFFTVEVMGLALRKWSVANCLGMTAAQAVYSEICKERGFQAKPVYLEGKEFAGVNNTFVQHKPEDISALETEFNLYGEKKKRPVIEVDPEKTQKALKVAGIAVLVLAVLFGVIMLVKNMDKVTEKPNEENPTVENQVDDPVDDTTDEQGENSADAPTDEVVDNPTDEEDTSSVSDGDYIFPDSNERLLTADEVASKTKEELRLARNEIFARYGAIFGVDDLDEYFRSKSWYTPSIPLSEFYDRVEMNMTEEQNINLIREYESNM